MQPIEQDDVLEVTLEGTNEQQPWALVRHYLAASVTAPQAFLDMLVDHFENVVLPAWQNVATTLWVAECISISRVAPKPMNVYYKGFAPAIVGEVATDGLPPQSAAIVRLLTDEVGPRNRGRAYLCGVPEASTNGGVLLASVQADWQLIATALAATPVIAGDSAVPCIFSRTSYGPVNPQEVPTAVNTYTSAITSGTLQGNIATQRRRRTKRNSFSS